MKRIILFLAITTASFGAINAQTAQQGPSAPQRAKTEVVNIHKAVGLHGNQFVDLNNIYIDYFTKLDALDAQKASLGETNYQSKLSALKSSRDTQVKTKLDAAQTKNWEAQQSKSGK